MTKIFTEQELAAQYGISDTVAKVDRLFRDKLTKTEEAPGISVVYARLAVIENLIKLAEDNLC